VAGWDPATFFTTLVDIVCFLNHRISIRWLDWFRSLVNAVEPIGGWIGSGHLSMPSHKLVAGYVPATCQCRRPNWWLDLFQPLLVNAVTQIGGWICSSHLLLFSFLFSFLLLFFLLLCVVIGDRCECLFFLLLLLIINNSSTIWSLPAISHIYILLYIYTHSIKKVAGHVPATYSLLFNQKGG
jgi:hypothetical protein